MNHKFKCKILNYEVLEEGKRENVCDLIIRKDYLIHKNSKT